MSKRILIVDDSSIIRAHCRVVLQRADYEILEAWDAAQARTALKKLEISFMLCDLNLPGMSGLDLVELMRPQSKLAELPVVIMSAEYSPDLVKRAKRAGVAHWLLKPYRAEELLDIVHRFAGPAAEAIVSL